MQLSGVEADGTRNADAPAALNARDYHFPGICCIPMNLHAIE
jgi:hypothetical protein